MFRYLPLLLISISVFSIPVNAVTLAEQLLEQSSRAITIEGHQSANQFGGKVQSAAYSLEKTLQITVEELRDTSGLVYVGGTVSAADLASYLAQMKRILGDSFVQFRQNQASRDSHSFHITLISPNEYQQLDKTKIEFGKKITAKLLGLGRVSNETKLTYFVVVNSSEATFYRQKLALSAKDFHITLGFDPSDIYNMRKGIGTLIEE